MRSVLVCRPKYFRVDYKINPWMKVGSTDKKKAMNQWNKLINIYKQLELNVEIIEQNSNFPDMVFAADQGFCLKNKTILLSRFRYKERQGESQYYKKWYKKKGYRVLLLPKNLYFEGCGELQEFKDNLLIGTGFRTNKKAAKTIGKIANRNTIILELVDERFYHLDTCLMVLNDNVIFYYPKAFSTESILKLKSLRSQLIEIDDKEVKNFAANSIVFNNNVVIQIGNPKIAEKIKRLGYKIFNINLNEYMKAGGGAHCLTGILY